MLNLLDKPSALRPLKDDDRDFNLAGVFPTVEKIPDEYCLTPTRVKNQLDTDFCSAYATTSLREQTEGIELSPEYQFAKTKEIMGEWEEWGADLRSACKAAVSYGSINQLHSPFVVGRDDRNKIADWLNWSTLLDIEALEHGANSYWSVNNDFDSICRALYTHRNDKAGILSGAIWRREWINTTGIIPTQYGEEGFGHAFAIIGYSKPKKHLVLQLSNGTDIGDRGFFYMPAEICKDELIMGNFMFKDMNAHKASFMHNNGLTIFDTFGTILKKVISKFFHHDFYTLDRARIIARNLVT